MKEIKKYKGISLKYNEQDGNIYFNFEDNERSTKYIFEAEKIIDEPVWEDCNMVNGYFVDGYIDKFIGLAIGLARATRKEIKSGQYDWFFMGQYDSEYKQPRGLDRDMKVYPDNSHNRKIYNEWKKQRIIYLQELRKLNKITNQLIK